MTKWPKRFAAFITSSMSLVSLVAFPALPASANYQSISILTSGYPSGANNTESEDMTFLATRSQRKDLTRSGVGPYTMTHTNANQALNYSYITDAFYGATSGSGHSGCTVNSQSGCLAQLRESDVRQASGMSYNVTSNNGTTAVL